jgi:hypothetical protein
MSRYSGDPVVALDEILDELTKLQLAPIGEANQYGLQWAIRQLGFVRDNVARQGVRLAPLVTVTDGDTVLELSDGGTMALETAQEASDDESDPGSPG